MCRVAGTVSECFLEVRSEIDAPRLSSDFFAFRLLDGEDETAKKKGMWLES